MSAVAFDVVVVGAGPAGLAAAAAAAERGARVAVLDAGAAGGGQYWRHGASQPAPAYDRLMRRLTGVELLSGHQAVTAERGGDGFALRCVHPVEPRSTRSTSTVRARRLVLATGSYDRQLPFPGWDLPGVLAAGGVQALLKQHGVLAGRRVVVAGTGPFLLPVAAYLLAAGAQVPAVVEANSPAGFARHPRAVLGALGKLGEALGYAATLARHRTPYLRRHAVVRVVGDDTVNGVDIARLDPHGGLRLGPSRRLSCDVLAVGWGFIAQLELQLQLGCSVELGADRGLAVSVDTHQRTDVDGVWAAGEATGIGGADLAIVEGTIAGCSAVGAEPTQALLRRRAALRRFAAALHAVHPLPPFLVADLPGDTVVCRCEEVTADAIRHSVEELGASDPRTVKLLCRAGMGWCQGRVCASATVALTARYAGRSTGSSELRALAHRPFSTPVSLSDLADNRGPS